MALTRPRTERGSLPVAVPTWRPVPGRLREPRTERGLTPVAAATAEVAAAAVGVAAA